MSRRYLTIVLAFMAVSACQTNKKDELLSSNENSISGQTVEAGATNEIAAQDASSSELDQVETDPVDQSIKTANVSGSVSSGAIQSYIPPKNGTVFTWRNNWANLPELISYKVAGKVRNGDTEYLKLTSVKGFKSTTHAYYLTKDFSLKGYRDKSNNAVMSFKPTEQRYRFPMAPGDKWLTSWKQVDHKTKKVTTGGGIVKVLGWEVLDLPAGRFKTLKVRMPVQKNAPRGLTHHTWFSPDLGITVKEEIGGGILSWSQILEKVEYPG